MMYIYLKSKCTSTAAAIPCEISHRTVFKKKNILD